VACCFSVYAAADAWKKGGEWTSMMIMRRLMIYFCPSFAALNLLLDFFFPTISFLMSVLSRKHRDSSFDRQ
jgi:hypothetical protein